MSVACLAYSHAPAPRQLEELECALHCSSLAALVGLAPSSSNNCPVNATAATVQRRRKHTMWLSGRDSCCDVSMCVCQIENRTLKAGSAQCHLFVLSPRAHKPGPAVHKSLWHPPNSREYHPMLRVETLSEWDSG